MVLSYNYNIIYIKCIITVGHYMQNSDINIPTINNVSEQGKVHNVNSSSSTLNIQNLDANNALLVNDFYTSFINVVHRKNSLCSIDTTLKQNLLSAHRVYSLLVAMIIIPMLGITIETLIQNYVRNDEVDVVDILCDVSINSIINSGLAAAIYCVYKRILSKNITFLLNNEELKFRTGQEQMILKDKIGIVDMLTHQKQAIFSYVHHEIRDPLQATLYILYELENSNLAIEQKESIKKCILFSKKIEKVLEGILKLQKLDVIKPLQERSKEAFTFSQLINVVFSQFKSQAIAKKLQLICNCNVDRSCMFEGDFQILTVILANLVSNAVKFSNNSSLYQENFIKLIIRKEKRITDDLVLFHFAVQDIGIGMGIGQIKRLFLPYYLPEIKMDNRSTESNLELGLGLYMSVVLLSQLNKHNIIENPLGVTSLLGTGSVVWFRTQLREKHLGSSLAHQKFTMEQHKEQTFFDNIGHLTTGLGNLNLSSTESMEAIIAKNLCVLVAEDQEVNQKIMETLLTKLGCQIVIVNNGQEAVDAVTMVDRKKYDIIFMDLEMPIMHGLDAAEIIINKKRLDIPIVACTANGTIEDERRCLSVGMREIIVKPVDLKKIIFTLNKIFVNMSAGCHMDSQASSSSTMDLLGDHSPRRLAVSASDSELLVNFNSKLQQRQTWQYYANDDKEKSHEDNEQSHKLDVKGKTRAFNI